MRRLGTSAPLTESVETTRRGWVAPRQLFIETRHSGSSRSNAANANAFVR